MIRAICTMHEAWDPDKYCFLPDIMERYQVWMPRRAVDPSSVFLVAEVSGEGGTGGTPVPRNARKGTGGSPVPREGKARGIAGYLISTLEDEISIYRVKQFAFIHDVWVEPEHRRHGVAKMLVNAAVARLAEIGVSQVRLDTARANESARRVFESCGFRVSTMEMLKVLNA